MSLGRKPAKAKAPVIEAPPQMTHFEFLSPTGDQYNVRRDGSSQFATTTLSPLSSQTVQTGQEALLGLADELIAPDNQRVQDIADKSLDYYILQAQGINAQADDILAQAESDLSKRFGGTYNATFGADYLARLENNRLAQLSTAAKEATLFGEDLYAQDEDSRIRRFELFQDYLTTEFDKANAAWSAGSNTLQNEAGRAQDLAVARANLVQNASRYNQEADLRARQQRLTTLNTLRNTTSQALKMLK